MFPKKKSTIARTDQKAQRLTGSGRTEAVASSVQQRIYMHENLYFRASDFSIYNSLVPLQIKRGSVSIEHVRLSLVSVIQQHTVLRTAIRFNPVNNQIEQYIQPLTNDIYSFEHSRGVCILEQLDLQRSTYIHDDLLHQGDLIILVLHHIAFDLSSTMPLVKAFEQACWGKIYQQSELAIPQYIDFALYEQKMLADTSDHSEMNKARQFWFNLMQGYDWNHIRYLVPYDGRTYPHKSGRGYSTVFTIDQNVVDAMMLFASTNNVTMFSIRGRDEKYDWYVCQSAIISNQT
ncbi:hypothetical protein I4U23_031539 [Adineta vaga]|nr:hypothetical protein I4U23_031539 [Adineta vaga]